MARANVSAGVRPRKVRTVQARRRATRAALSASGIAPADLTSNYDMSQGSPAERYFLEQAMGAGFANIAHDKYPCDEPGIDATAAEFRTNGAAIFRTDDGTLVLAELGYGWMHISVAASDSDLIAPVFSAFRSTYPASYLAETTDERVPITFWANSNFGPTARLRKVDSALWDGITENYTAEVGAKLGALMAWQDGPPAADGQLILWQGPPGTGKSWALRALASEWHPWAEFHYITDPDSFFVDDPSYMIQVLLADSYEAIDQPTGDIYSTERPESKWRILILEDTGELLSANAKEKYGQGLSRLLNVVDGMIGQGLKVLALVTTNDELGDLHPAVIRPGRCAMQIEFGPLTDEEAQAWTQNPDATAGTIAELYAKYGRAAAAAIPEEGPTEKGIAASLRWEREHPGGRLPMPKDMQERLGIDLADDGAIAPSVVDSIRTVAERHQPDGGYGETAYHSGDRAIYWVPGDWSTDEEIGEAESDFMAIDGVDSFTYEAEASLPDGEGWEQVYPEEVPDDEDLAAVVALAAEPLDVPAPAAFRNTGAINAAMSTLAQVHGQTIAGLNALIASDR